MKPTPKRDGGVEPLVSPREVLKFLDISSRQLNRLLRDRDDNGNPQIPLPSHIVGQTRKFFLSEVREWVRASKARAAQ